MLWIRKSTILPTTNYLKYNDSKAKNIRFYRERSMHCIFWRHITTARKNNEVWKTFIKRDLNNFPVPERYNISNIFQRLKPK